LKDFGANRLAALTTMMPSQQNMTLKSRAVCMPYRSIIAMIAIAVHTVLFLPAVCFWSASWKAQSAAASAETPPY
jgi:hypothetical protein